MFVCISSVMKSETQNLKTGHWRVTPENADDVWLLSTIIEAGDRCTALTTRKIQVGESSSERKTMVLSLDVEKVAFEGESLRVLGVVREGTQDVPSGEHHSFLVSPGTSITMVKPHWGHDQVQRLRQACDTQPPPVLIVVFDREEAAIAMMRRSGYQLLMRLSGQVERKRLQQHIGKQFFDELASVIKDYDERLHPASIVLASPAFWKEEFLPFVPDSIRKKVVLATSAGGHEQAINEVLRRDEVRTALAQDRTTHESRLVEQLLAGIAKGSAVAYGLADVRTAAENGAVSTLLISDGRIAAARRDDSFGPIDALMRQVDSGKGEVVIVASTNDGGKKLDGLGGIAAILRFRLS
jgi:protein pelota